MKKLITVLFLPAFLFLFLEGALAQENEFAGDPDADLFKSASALGWVKFKDGLTVNPLEIFTVYKESFGLTGDFGMRLKRTKSDDVGLTHYRFQETLSGYDVIGGEFLIHVKNGTLYTGNGKLYTTPVIRRQKNLSETDAVSVALKYVDAKRYWWQDTLKENRLRKKTNNQSSTYYPKPELCYYYFADIKELRLAYKILIQTFDTGKSGYVYIDAGDGNTFKWVPVEISCSPSTVLTNWYNYQTVNTYYNPVFEFWELEDDCTPSIYKVYDAASNDGIFISLNNQWNYPRERSAATCLWSIRQTRDIYKNTLNRDGHNGADGNLDIYFDYDFGGGDKDNASYHYDWLGDDEINVGTNDPSAISDDWGTLDLMAHEFTHGVTQYEAQLVYEKEPGALNESFSDVMGEFVENKVFGSNNWLMGSDRTLNIDTLTLRNFQSPHLKNDPDRYLTDLYWVDVTGCTPTGPPGGNDWCGVHTNSGVQNRMFYLLSEGGSGWTNDATSTATSETGVNPYAWTVSPIGIDKAGRIAYKALRDYLVSNSNYFDSRNAWVCAAAELYGECSFEAIQTGKAWHAVGIGPPDQDLYVCGDYGSTPYYLTTPKKLIIANSCSVNILPSGNLVAFKGTRIDFKPGFKSILGSKFSAKVDDECKYAAY